MNRNVESHFSQLPSVDINRSRFDRSSSVKTSFNVGSLIPFYVDEVLPGDTFKVKTSKVVRMQPMVAPIMDNIYLDTYYFFVPNRLVWSHWRELMGENTESAWLPQTEYSVPQVTSPASTGWAPGTIADYMGIPVGVPGLSVNALPFRAYALICNEWFRDENLTDPVNIPVGDTLNNGSNGNNYVTDLVKGGQPFLASKYHDYFTSCLPSPQKGPNVTIPIAQLADMPVVSKAATHDGNEDFVLTDKSSKGFIGNYTSSSVTDNGYLFLKADSNVISGVPGGLKFTNLWAQGSNALTATSINELRMAFQIQKLYEKDARGGTRYIELLKSHFGVTSPDARLQRPEYLGGNRIPITINQVLQQSATVEGSTPQGTPTGLSLTSDTNSDFTKSFVEHGFVIGVMVARYDHTYQQGLNRMWSRKSRFDYYWPVFANIGEQAVLNKEIYAQGTTKDDQVFGYQEAWADYRYRPNIVTGEMRSSATVSLDVWHLADDYGSLPSLSDSWIREDKSNVDRSLAIKSTVSNQLWADIYIQNICTRPMPMYSIPGLIDHH